MTATNNRPQPGRSRTFRGIALVFLVAVISTAVFAAIRWDIVWGAVPGRVGAPDSTIPAEFLAPGANPGRVATQADPSPSEGAVGDTISPLTVEGPTTNTRVVRLAVLGDVGTGDSHEWATADLVAEAAAGRPFDALVLLGDNVYPNGDPRRLQDTVFGPFGAVLEQGTSLLPVLGNHDIQDGHAAGQVAALAMPGRWYVTDMGPVLLIALDSNLVEDPEQLLWLEATLAGAEAPWVIVAMHHPAYSAGYHGSDEEIQKTWVPMFERYDVDLVLSGHDHDYQRTTPIAGVTYIVSGGGAKTRPTERADYTAYAASVLHFLDITVAADRLQVTAISSNGAFDHVIIEGKAPGK